MIIVSACLAGIKCRYNGESYGNEEVARLVSAGKALPVCPEQLGGLPTPRYPAEIRNGAVVDSEGRELTDAFYAGAEEVLRLCRLTDCKKAILKARSPSCGCGQIYDGSFSGRLVSGNGVLARLLLENGIDVMTEEAL